MAYEGQNVYFICNSIKPVEWSYLNGTLPFNGQEDSPHTYKIIEVVISNAGVYQCKATQPSGTYFALGYLFLYSK